MIDTLPKADAKLSDRGYDGDWFRHALIERGITPRIERPTARCHSRTIESFITSANRIENMFGQL